MIDTNAIEVILILVTSIIGMIGIGAAMIGYWYRSLHIFERIIALIGGLFMIFPGTFTDIIGLFIFGFMLAVQFFFKREEKIEEKDVQKQS